MLADYFYVIGSGDVIAYVDGGTGSLIFQAAIGGALSGVYFLTTQWRRIKGWVSNRPRKGSIDS